jgi:hypothetical protein
VRVSREWSEEQTWSRPSLLRYWTLSEYEEKKRKPHCDESGADPIDSPIPIRIQNVVIDREDPDYEDECAEACHEIEV